MHCTHPDGRTVGFAGLHADEAEKTAAAWGRDGYACKVTSDAEMRATVAAFVDTATPPTTPAPMTTVEAFEYVELEIADKRRKAAAAREYCGERPTLNKLLRTRKLHNAVATEQEADALQIVLNLARGPRS